MSSAMTTTFTPHPGFVVKSTTLRAGFYHHNPAEFASAATSNSSESAAGSSRSTSSLTNSSAFKVSVPSNRKVFINLAYASEIPPPSIHDEAVIQRALLGQSQPEVSESHSEYFIPVLVGFGREDKDKAGSSTTVFDAFLNPAVKKRLTEDINYRSYVLEIILSILESPPHFATNSSNSSRSLSLSRTLATPNVRFKGSLLPRRVAKIELEMLGAESLRSSSFTPKNQTFIPPTPDSAQPKRPLVEEISSAPTSTHKQIPKTILKKTPDLPDSQLSLNLDEDPHVKTSLDVPLTTPMWRWSLEKPGTDVVISITIDVPDMDRSAHSQSTLSLSTDILTFRSSRYFLQIPLNSESVKLPPNRTVDVDKAKSEWRIGENSLVVTLQCVLKT